MREEEETINSTFFSYMVYSIEKLSLQLGNIQQQKGRGGGIYVGVYRCGWTKYEPVSPNKGLIELQVSLYLTQSSYYSNIITLLVLFLLEVVRSKWIKSIKVEKPQTHLFFLSVETLKKVVL